MNPTEPLPTAVSSTAEANPLTTRRWDAETWDSVLDTTSGTVIVPLLAPIFAPGYTLARVQGNANEIKERVKGALAKFQLYPSKVHLLSVRELQNACRSLERRLPEPVYRHLPHLLTEALRVEVCPDLEVTLRTHPDVAHARQELGLARWLRLEQALRTAFLAVEQEGVRDPFFGHPVTDPLGDRAARNVRFVLQAAIMAAILRENEGKPHRLAEDVQPLLWVVQAGYFPLGATFEGNLVGGYLVLVA